ncbi:hypothetical protein ACFWU5_28690 [Nocardia sp. NPDC058640]|uniref:hypothetical protein n=1 Tax=Nocardia sp. NPDC058640 TaxID=3346571 RepID=UPI003659DD68
MMTEFLVTAADSPGITYTQPSAAAAAQLGAIGMASGKDSPECAARNSAIRMITTDLYAGALTRVATADGEPRYDVQIAVLNRVVDTAALAATMRGCTTASAMTVTSRDGSTEQMQWEAPVPQEITGVGPIVAMTLLRELGDKASGSMPTASVVRFVTVGGRTVVEYVSGDLLGFEVSAQSLALGDRVLTAQVAKLRAL